MPYGERAQHASGEEGRLNLGQDLWRAALVVCRPGISRTVHQIPRRSRREKTGDYA